MRGRPSFVGGEEMSGYAKTQEAVQKPIPKVALPRRTGDTAGREELGRVRRSCPGSPPVPRSQAAISVYYPSCSFLFKARKIPSAYSHEAESLQPPSPVEPKPGHACLPTITWAGTFPGVTLLSPSTCRWSGSPLAILHIPVLPPPAPPRVGS